MACSFDFGLCFVFGKMGAYDVYFVRCSVLAAFRTGRLLGMPVAQPVSVFPCCVRSRVALDCVSSTPSVE